MILPGKPKLCKTTENVTVKTVRLPSNEDQWYDVLLHLNNSLVMEVIGFDTPVDFQNAIHRATNQSVWAQHSFLPHPFNIVLNGPLILAANPPYNTEFGTTFRFYTLGSFSQVFRALSTFEENLHESSVEVIDF